MNENSYEVKLLVECEICERLIDKDEAHEVLDATYVCNLDIDERCLGTWNNENSFPTQLDSYFYD